MDTKIIRRIVVHADCPDGTASAMILHDAFPDAKVEAVQYGPEREALEPSEGMLFCDMTPPEAKVDRFVEARAIVLDHHKGAEELVAKFGGRGVFADEEAEPGVSGAVLAYRLWAHRRRGGFTTDEVERFAVLAGTRDTWWTDSPWWSDACSQAEVLQFHTLEYWLSYGQPYLARPEADLGRVLYHKKLEAARKIAEGGCLRLDNVLIYNDPGRTVSDVAEAVRSLDPSVEIVVGFFYTVRDGEMSLVFSLRSGPNGPDVSEIAKANGGGGHTHAAGFTVPVRGIPGSPLGVLYSALIATS